MSDDPLLFLPGAQDERLWMGIHKTDSGRFLVLNLGGKQQNESWVIDLEGAACLLACLCTLCSTSRAQRS